MDYGDGSGNTVYKNVMYFTVAPATWSRWTFFQHPGAAYNNRFSYAGVSWNILDFAIDKEILSVLCATE